MRRGVGEVGSLGDSSSPATLMLEHAETSSLAHPAPAARRIDLDETRLLAEVERRTEQALIEGARAGDERALRKIYERHNAQVRAHLHRMLGVIRAGGAEAGVALNPTTPPESIEWALPQLDYILVLSVNPGFGGQSFIPEMIQKIERLKEMTDLPIQVDGGINAETAPLVTRAGATVLVAGSAVYKGDPAVEMRKIIEAGQQGSTSAH